MANTYVIVTVCIACVLMAAAFMTSPMMMTRERETFKDTETGGDLQTRYGRMVVDAYEEAHGKMPGHKLLRRLRDHAMENMMSMRELKEHLTQVDDAHEDDAHEADTDTTQTVADGASMQNADMAEIERLQKLIATMAADIEELKTQVRELKEREASSKVTPWM